MSYIEQLGQTLGTQAGEGILGMILGGINDKRQIRQQQKLTDMQVAAQKNMGMFNMQQQLQMWKDTSYPAQIEQMKKAGINPGLLYGMSGGGGQTTGNPNANVTGGTAQQNPGEIQGMIGMGIQNGLMEAQRKLIEAQTKNVETDTAKKAGVDTEKVKTEIASLTQGIHNQQAQYWLTRADTNLKDLQLAYEKETYADRVDYVMYNTSHAMENLMQAQNETYISRATMNAKIDTIRTQAIEAVLKNALIQAQTEATHVSVQKALSDIELNQQAIKKMAAEINQNWDKLDIEQFNAEIKAAFPSVGNTIGNWLNTGIEELQKTIGDNTDSMPYKVHRQSKK